jgi:hypothetical protein
VLRCLPLLLLILSTCPAPGGRAAHESVVPARAADSVRIEGELTLDAGRLRWSGAPDARLNIAGSPQPYRVVTVGTPTLITTIGADLRIATFAVADSITKYDEQLPWVADPPIVALAPLPADIAGAAAGLTLLRPDGSAGWTAPGADLLWPAAGDSAGTAYCILPGKAPDLIHPYGAGPLLVAIDCTTFVETARLDLGARFPVADAQLAAVGPRLSLLWLQYGFNQYDVLLVDFAAGAVVQRYPLTGFPAYRNVYPGPTAEPADLELDGHHVTVRIFDEAAGWQAWRFDLEGGGLSLTAAAPPAGATEDNPLPAGGSGAPGPGHAPFPPHVLPMAHGDAWSIPALVNAQGEVLVVADGQASWVKP